MMGYLARFIFTMMRSGRSCLRRLSKSNCFNFATFWVAKGGAGALFSINNQNYSLAAKLIRQVKDLSKKHNRPVSIIQDVSDMTDPLDLEFGLRTGVDWVATDNAEHLKMTKGLNKLAGL